MDLGASLAPNTSAPVFVVVPLEFDLSDDVRTRCWIVIGTSVFPLLCGALVCYVYYVHPHYKTYLRSIYNNMFVACILMKLVLAVTRPLTAALLLSGHMTPDLCNILGALDVGFVYASFVLFHGFYYNIMALSYHPLRWVLLLCMSREKYDDFRHTVFSRYFYFFTFALSATNTGLSFMWLGSIRTHFPGQDRIFPSTKASATFRC